MRNLKRALSLALASVMVLSMMVIGAGAASYDDFSDKDKIVNKEAVQMLVELGVINGKDTGDFDPTGIVTRAEMAKMICVVLNGGKDPSLGSTVTNSYTDTVGHWAAGYIEYCTQLGIVAGDGAGKFNPNTTVTGSEAAKMLLVALGYKSEVEGFIGANWAIGVNVRANQKGLYSDLTISVDEGLTRDSAAQMIYNALDAGVVSYDYTLVTDGSTISSSPTLIDDNSKTLLEDKFNAVKVEGVVVANEYANLDAESAKGSALDEGKTKIAITNDEDQGSYKGTETFAVASGADELGRSVVIYVKKNSNAAKAEVLGTAITSADNVVVKDTSSDSIKDVADDNDLTFDAKAQIAYNYGMKADLTDKVKTAAGATGVEKLLIDTDDDGDVDYVLVNTLYFGQVSKYSTKDDGSITIDINKAWTEDKTASNLTADDKADVVGFDDVAADDYVMAAWIGGKLYVSAADSVTGVLESLKPGKNLTVDGTKYTASTVGGFRGGDASIVGAADVSSEYLDIEATYYLDKNGLVVAVGDAAATAGNYAYVWGVSADAAGIDNNRVKVTLQDGTTKTYEMASNSVKPNLTTDTSNDATADKNGGNENRIYAYTINGDGEIKLSTPKNGNANNTSRASFEKGKTSVGTMSDDTNVSNAKQTNYANSSTVFFYVELKGTKIDDVEVYTGYANAPSVTYATAEAAYNNAGKMAAAAFEGGTVSIKDVSDALYITKFLNNSTDYSEVEAILAGTNEVIKIKVNDNTLDDDDANLIYLYSIDNDGNYDLKTPAQASLTASNYVADADVTNISKTTVVVNGTGAGEYKLTDKTVWVEQKANGKFNDASLDKLPANADRGTVTSMLYNNDGEIVFIVTKAVDANAGKPTDAESVVSKASGNNIDGVATDLGGSSSNQNLAQDLKNGMQNVTVTMDGSTVSIGGTIGYTKGLDGFNGSKPEENNGYYAILQIKVPAELKDVTHYQIWKADWGTNGEWSANAKLDGSNSDYFVLVLRLDDGGRAPKDMKVQWTKSNGDVVGTSTVSFDVSELTFG